MVGYSQKTERGSVSFTTLWWLCSLSRMRYLGGDALAAYVRDNWKAGIQEVPEVDSREYS